MEDKKFNLIVSDIMMEEMDGFEFAKRVREIDNRVPILFMTALDDISSKTKGYKIGIDDYMVKPVDLNELALRIGALLKRAGIESSMRLEVGDFLMDREEFTTYWKGEEIVLTKREFDLC